MNKKLIAISIIVVFLMSVMPAYGLVVIIPPPPETFNGAGFTYAITYDCHSGASQSFVDIAVHNNKKSDQFVYIKILDDLNSVPPNFANAWALSNWGSGNSPTYRFLIPADGLLSMDCYSIKQYLGEDPGFPSHGLIVISYPGGTPPLDVIASYTFIAMNGAATDSVGGNRNVVYVPGVRVSNVPTPCVPMPKDPTKCEKLPL